MKTDGKPSRPSAQTNCCYCDFRKGPLGFRRLLNDLTEGLILA